MPLPKKVEKQAHTHLFEPDRHDLCDLYDEFQTCQADLASDQEMGFFYASEFWHRSKLILDAGTGNGHYLRKLAAQFPDKSYCGIDPNRDLIALAKKGAQLPNIEFHAQNFADCKGHFDSIIARLLLQHLENAEEFFYKAKTLVPIGGSVFVIDADDKIRYFHPEPQDFLNFFDVYRNQQANQGLDRDIVDHLTQNENLRPGWSIVEQQIFTIPSTVSGRQKLFCRAYNLFLEIVKTSGLFDKRINVAKEDLNRWCRLPNAYTQIGLHWIRLERVE